VKKAMVLFILISAIQLMAVDKIQITVKDASTSNGVVLVTISNAGKTAELQCTESAPFCATPKAGTYWMVRLPKNHGVYDCQNVDLYLQASDPENGGQALGEYCLNER
jgi:hypothetical protein